MSTANFKPAVTGEPCISEIPPREPPKITETAKAEIDPNKLLKGLKDKQKILNLIEGYVDKKEISEMKRLLKGAIDDLENMLRIA